MPEHTVISPVPGVFYRRPDPDSPLFAEEGDTVSAGQTIGLVEIMKNFQEVETEVDGRLSRFVVEDQAVIKAGEPVAIIEVG
jgi:acetyl-CoA carboxylase biotin carboxyl carrier protein